MKNVLHFIATWDTTFVPTMIGAVVSTQLSKKLQENKSSDEMSSVDDSSSDSDITSERFDILSVFN